MAPFAGGVAEAVDGLPDLTPPEAEPENPAGNHVVVACNGLLVLLVHLRVGSVAVETGEAVTVGQAVGAVGNSGNTTEPHLHIHAVLEGTGSVLTGEAVPILFDGRHPVRNAVFAR
ncbi:MAG: peptidoglycan DD-metalloendopeptidase family protein [Aliihoeflea sp.]